jgi:hypothetical protein
MKNPLFSSSLFVTPDSFEDLQNMIESYSPSEKSLAYQVSMFTMNLCHKLVQEQIDIENSAKKSPANFSA